MYATAEDLRDEGVASASDERLVRLCEEATALIERVTGQFFEARTLAMRVNGRGTPTIELAVPLIRLTRVAVDYEGCAFPSMPGASFDISIDTHTMDVRGAPVGPDFTGSYITLRNGLFFPRGHGNVALEGLWGFTEYDGTRAGRTPLAIRRACMLLVLRNLPPLADDASLEARSRWRLLEERTRDQSYRLDSAKGNTLELTGDPEVDTLLLPYVKAASIGAA